ncbi:MAG: GerW family sporulation protein [Lachnospiraceae bacterium]|nr:GerW family sporulation protein [Lachnospiraceae bacterium]
MSDNNKFQNTVESLFKGMDGFLTTKTVVGEAVSFDDGTVILPLVEVSFGVAAGAWTTSKGVGKTEKGTSGGGMGGKITPSAVIVLKDGHAKLVNVKNQDIATKVLDMIPDVVDRFTSSKKDKKDLKDKVDSVVGDETPTAKNN